MCTGACRKEAEPTPIQWASGHFQRHLWRADHIADWILWHQWAESVASVSHILWVLIAQRLVLIVVSDEAEPLVTERMWSRLIWHGIPSILATQGELPNIVIDACQVLDTDFAPQVVNVSLFPRPSSPQGFDHLKTGDEEQLTVLCCNMVTNWVCHRKRKANTIFLFFSHKLHYFLDCYNYLDASAVIFTFLIIPSRVAGSDVQWIFGALAYLFNGLRAFKYAAVFRYIHSTNHT